MSTDQQPRHHPRAEDEPREPKLSPVEALATVLADDRRVRPG